MEAAAMECLRPFVNAKPWEYIVVWILGDDPSRFIQWGACCCSGANRVEKDENGGVKEECCCRDQIVKHSIQTKACRRLALLPSVIPLYSGIHGDVATSKQPVWTTASSSDNEPKGTQVVIPVDGGLVEFFSSKHVARDQKMIDYVSARFGQETVMDKPKAMAMNLNQLGDHLLEPDSYDWQIHCLNFLPQLEASSLSSNLSTRHRQLMPSDHASCPKPKRKKCTDSVSVIGAVKNRERGPYKSKNLVTERNRRERIKAGMFALRALVPKISKMDRVATLGDAAEYIEELLESIEDYKSQIQAMEDEDKCGEVINAEPDCPLLKNAVAEERLPPPIPTPPAEVSRLGAKDFAVKVACAHRRGGFSRLMEALDALGLQVVDANVTTLNGSMSSIVLRVQGGNEEVDPKSLECLLIQLVA
ncbi:transcription factor bHLH90-like isoform X2 [Andrographis paniculata]|uniref:transcription factor bHLH90-like isoform X2 n=1 Tax=Andrographis paniculata TaxID=175694 RepID=UPI0021E7CC01|nr:transcription factor bHLH90-like isoform X2 [Andrographis paniculata]